MAAQLDLYNECKEMPNLSIGLLGLLKKNRYSRIWGYVDHNKVSKFVTLKELRTKSLSEMELRIGSPSMEAFSPTADHVQARSFTGTPIVAGMFYGRKPAMVCLVGIGTKKKGAWFIDVTERVVENIKTIGACALSEAHCQMEVISPKIKECKFCKRRLYKKVEIRKVIHWNKKD